MSPLDNALFHDWKEAVRNHGEIHEHNIVQLMADEWNKINKKTVRTYFHHCGLIHGKNPYFDCPDPSSHRHTYS